MSSETRAIGNTLTRDGALELATKINNYWAMKGRSVTVMPLTCNDLGEASALGGTVIWCVRSNMVGGFPPSNPKTEVKIKARKLRP